MKKLVLWIRGNAVSFLGMKLLYRLIFIYIIGGAIPMILTGNYLINGMSQILIQQEKDAKAVEIETMKRQILESLNTINTVSKYFFFDKNLENIAFRKYARYQDNVDDFKEYTAFGDYRKYNSNVIQRIRVYLKNDTMTGNSLFVKVNKEISSEKWYQDALKGNGAAVWRYIPTNVGDISYLSLARLLRTSKHQDVGILVIDARNKSFLDIMNDWDSNTLLLLNKEEKIVSTGDNTDLDAVKDMLPELGEETVCKNIRYQGEKYVMTCADIPLPESADHIQIVSLQSYMDILKEANKKSERSAIFYFFSLLISTILIVLFSKSFSNRVDCFCKQMKKAVAGDFNLEKGLEGNDEISELYDYLGTMIWSIQSLISEVYREQLQKERLKTKQRDAEFKMLASQINPHFLYNTLETIRMKARAQGEYDIEELVKMLALILRHNIQAGNHEVTIKSEVELMEYYLRIQQYRFGERIQYHIKIEDELEKQMILPLIMQPLIENSIIHGLESKEGTGNIYIDIQKNEQNNISIVIEDDGLGMESSRLEELQYELKNFDNLESSHIGISNVYQRIKLLYGDAYGMTISSQKNIGTKVKVIIPVRKDGEEIR